MPATPSPYKYLGLQKSEIRLVELFPAQRHEDDITLAITHHTLSPDQDSRTAPRLSRKELQKSLPEGWEVFETPEGGYLFCYDPNDEEDDGDENNTQPDGSSNDSDFLTTWNHPDPSFDRALYELPPETEVWDKDPVFEALSYTWGAQDDPGTAFIRSSSDNTVTTLPIGRNLEYALRSLRSTSIPRTLWIDAVCINQNDDGEKAIQVVRMSDIYSLATRVVVWLGSAEDDSDLAMSTLAYLGAQVETTLDGFRLTSPGAEEPTWYDIDVSLPYSEKQWKAIDSLISRPWFGRVWTAQEIQLANRLAIVQLGGAVMSWSLFRRAIDCLKDKSSHGKERLPLSILTSSTMNAKGRPLFDLFRRYRHRECSNAHDKVYGILAMVPPAFASMTHPDYTQPVAKTYKDAFIANTGLMGRWDLFGSDVIDRTAEFNGVPSWVPDFVSTERHSYFSELLQFTSGNSRLEYKFSNADKFHVRGVHCAVVKNVGMQCPSHARVGLKTIRSWEPDNLYTGTYVTGEPLVDAFVRTLVQNDLRERNPTDKGWPSLAELKDYCKRHIFSDATEAHKSFDGRSYLDDMISGRCAKRHFIDTEEGYIGLGPRDCKAGDIVCVVLGCNSPVILRPLSDNKYRLVGNSFVYGLNDAQALLGKLSHPWRVQIFDHPDQDFRIEHRYFNEETGESTALDPRVEDHPDWERVPLEDLGRTLTGDDPLVLEFFRNKVTGNVVNSNPKLLPDELEARGVDLQWLTIV